MRECDTLVDSETYRLHRPELDTIASHLMRGWCEWHVAEIASAFKVSTSLAAEVKRMAYEFPNKSTGCKALEAYTGVEKQFGFTSLPLETGNMRLNDRRDFMDMFKNTISDMRLLSQKKAAAYYQYSMQAYWDFMSKK